MRFLRCFNERERRALQQRRVSEEMCQKQTQYYHEELRQMLARSFSPIVLWTRCAKCNLSLRKDEQHIHASKCNETEDNCEWCGAKFIGRGPHGAKESCPLRPDIECKNCNKLSMNEKIAVLPPGLGCGLKLCTIKGYAREIRHHEKHCKLECALCHELVLADEYLTKHCVRGDPNNAVCQKMPFPCKWMCQLQACGKQLAQHEAHCSHTKIGCISCGELMKRSALISNGKLYRCDFCAYKYPSHECPDPYSLRQLQPKRSRIGITRIFGKH